MMVSHLFLKGFLVLKLLNCQVFLKPMQLTRTGHGCDLLHAEGQLSIQLIYPTGCFTQPKLVTFIDYQVRIFFDKEVHIWYAFLRRQTHQINAVYDYYFGIFSNMISTRRFMSRPCSVSLDVIGLRYPTPFEDS